MAFELHRNAGGEKVFITTVSINRSEAIEVAKARFHEHVARTNEVSGVRFQKPRVISGDGIEIV